MVRSITRQGMISSRLRCWVGVSSRSTITRSMSSAAHCSAISCARPLPRQVALSGASFFCVAVPATSAPAVAASSASSASDTAASNSPVSTLTSSARSGACSVISCNSIWLPPFHTPLFYHISAHRTTGKRIFAGCAIFPVFRAKNQQKFVVKRLSDSRKALSFMVQ